MKAIKLDELTIFWFEKITVSWYWLFFCMTFFIMVNDCIVQCDTYLARKVMLWKKWLSMAEKDFLGN